MNTTNYGGFKGTGLQWRHVAWFTIGITALIVWMTVWVPHNDKNLMKTYGPESQAVKTK
jgi:hypothetical protein